jgi:predicted N-formylglutamate amidohydrolase
MRGAVKLDDDTPYEVLPASSPTAPFVLTCEHASNALPEWEAEGEERRLLEQHWSWDIGAADVTRALAAQTGSGAVLSRFSRLVCDPNRAAGEPTFVVERVEGRALSWNLHMDDAERARRRARYADPYHAAIDEMLVARRAAGPVHLLSIHSFTPVHGDEVREMELGLLFDRDEGVAEGVAAALAEQGFRTTLNEPYSGYAGFIYSVRRHGRRHAVPYLELEIRQDLISDPLSARGVARRLGEALPTAFSPASTDSGGPRV